MFISVNWTMLASAIALFFMLPATSEPSATRLIPASCQMTEGKATQYFEEHDFYTRRKTENQDSIIEIGSLKDTSTPSAKPLSLDRSSVHKYTLPKHLSPLKAYTNFQLKGELRLAKAAEGYCTATLQFRISAYEWVWVPVVMDDGYRSEFISNGTLERLYLDSFCALFKSANR